MPARSWDVWPGTQEAVGRSAAATFDHGGGRSSASDWSLQRVGLATALVTLALLACATSARAEDGLGIAEVAAGQPDVTAVSTAPAQSGPNVSPTDNTTVQNADGGGSAEAAIAAVPVAGDDGSATIAPSVTSTGEPTAPASTGTADTTFAEIATQTSQDVRAGAAAGAASESADGATAMSAEPGEEIAAGAPTGPVAADGLAAPPTNELATTPEPTSPVAAAGASGEAQDTAPDAATTGVSAAVSGAPIVAGTVTDPVTGTLDQTAVSSPPSSTPSSAASAPVSEPAAPAESLVAATPAGEGANSTTTSGSEPAPEITVTEPVMPTPTSEPTPPTEPVVATSAGQEAASTSTSQASAPVVAPSVSAVTVENSAPATAPGAIEKIAPAAKTVTSASVGTPTSPSSQAPIGPAAPADAATVAVEPATAAGTTIGEAGTSIGPVDPPTIRRAQAPSELAANGAGTPVAETESGASLPVPAAPRTAVGAPTPISTPLRAPDLSGGVQAGRDARPTVVAADSVAIGPTAPVALPPLTPPATIEIVLADGSTTRRVRPTVMQLRSISFGLGISVERLSGLDGAISIRIDHAGHVTVENGSGTRFTPAGAAATSLITGVAAAIRFNRDAADDKVVTVSDVGLLPRVPLPNNLPAPTPVASGATWAPAGGPGQGGFGLGSILGITMAAFATGAVTFRLGRRLRLTAEPWRPVAFHSPLERPA